MTGFVQSMGALTVEADTVLASGQSVGAITAARLRQLVEDMIVSYLNLPGSALASSPSYDNDSLAAAGGVPVGGIYRNGNFVMVRLS